MSDNKKPRIPKPKGDPKAKDDLSALFTDKETEEAFHEWRRANANLMPLSEFKKLPDVLQWLFYARAEFWVDQYSKGWQDALDQLSEQGELVQKLALTDLPKAVGWAKLNTILEHLPAIQANQERLIALAKGRQMGAEAQKQYAAETQKIIFEINSDLLKNPNTARWDLDRRAGYIAEKLSEQGRRQLNGNPYMASTIKSKITGKG